jgi:hypothetical protein
MAQCNPGFMGMVMVKAMASNGAGSPVMMIGTYRSDGQRNRATELPIGRATPTLSHSTLG